MLKTALQALYLTDLHLYVPAQLLILRGEVLEVRRPLISVLRPPRTFNYVYGSRKLMSGGKKRGLKLDGPSYLSAFFVQRHSYPAIPEQVACRGAAGIGRLCSRIVQETNHPAASSRVSMKTMNTVSTQIIRISTKTTNIVPTMKTPAILYFNVPPVRTRGGGHQKHVILHPLTYHFVIIHQSLPFEATLTCK